MIDWLTVVIALVIITSLVGVFGYFAWKINESDTFLFGGPTPDSVDLPVEKKKGHEQTRKKRKEQKKPKRETKDGEAKQTNQSEETDEESEQVNLFSDEFLLRRARFSFSFRIPRRRNRRTCLN